MANTVLAPLERHVGRIPGVEETFGEANQGSVTLNVRFAFGVNVDKAAQAVQAALNAAQPDLPQLPSPPAYFKFDTSQIPILNLALTSTSLPPERLYDLADTLLRPVFAQIPGVSQVQVFGGTLHAVRVIMNTASLSAMGLTANDIRNALIAANVTSPQGVLSDGQTQMTIGTNDALHTPRDFAGLVIATRGGTPVHLADVAKVESGEEDRYQAAWFMGRRTVGVQINKRPEANAVATAGAVRAKLPLLKRYLPADVEVTPIFDLTEGARSALHEVEIALLISMVLVALVMLVFLRSLRPMLIAALSVPLSLSGAFVVMWALGYTLNTLSLVALVLCIGFVVDDAIVVVENIVRHMERGESALDASLRGVREIGFTIVSITLSLMAVFAPLLFGNNMLIVLLREFSVTLTAAVVISAIVSLTLTPALCGRFLIAQPPGKPSSWAGRALLGFDRWLNRHYERALNWAMLHRRLMRWQPLVLLILTVLLAVAVVKTAGGTFMPDEDTGQLSVMLRADANISPRELTRRVEQARRILEGDPAILDVLTVLGAENNGSGAAVGNNATMYADLKPYGAGPGERRENIKEVIGRLKKKFEPVAGIGAYFNAIQFFNGSGAGDHAGQYEFQIVDTSGRQALQPITLNMVRKLRVMPQFSDVSSNFDLAGTQRKITIDREKAGRLHVNIGDIDAVLLNAFGQNQVSVIYSDINQYRVVLTSFGAQTASSEALLNLYVRNTQGQMIRLSALASVEADLNPLGIRHRNQQEVATINYNLAQKIAQSQGMALIEQAALAVHLPPGVKLDFTGTNQQLQQARSNGIVLLLAAIAAMYIVLGVLYESLGHPLTILSTLPAAGMGAFLAMLITHTPLSLMVIIAVLMLIGIVKKNAILMVDFALVAQREHGLSPPDAIREAALARFRPITMTTVVAMGAALPLAIGWGMGSEMRQPLGIASMGGLLVSQPLTLLSTPAIYLWSYDRKQRKAARTARRAEKRRLREKERHTVAKGCMVTAKGREP